MNLGAIISVETYFLNFITTNLIGKNKRNFINRKTASELYLLSHVHQLLIRNTKSSKRNLFYMNVELFRSQKYLDFIIESVSKKIGLSRNDMNIEASNKSLVYGDVTLNHKSHIPIHCLSSQNGVSLPSGFTFFINDLKLIKFILVVEKDATFQHLIITKFCDLFHPCILITAKGYPDLNCRFLLNSTEAATLNIPIFCLVDADPYGLSIYCTYKYGSNKSSLLNYKQEIVRSQQMKLIGLLATDIEKLQLQRNEIMPLSSSDKKILTGLQNKPFFQTDIDIKEQAECFLRMEIKAEIQSLDHLGADYLTKEYLYKKLIQNGIIPSIFF